MKRNKDKRIFAKILIRYIICTVVFSIPLWVFGDRYLLLIEDVTGSESFYDIKFGSCTCDYAYFYASCGTAS